MPDEPMNDNPKPESTPHFDEFSGKSNSASSFDINQAPKPGPKVPEEPEEFQEPKLASGPVPVGDGPMTNFSPNPSVPPEQSRVPEAQQNEQASIEVEPEKSKRLKSKKLLVGLIAVVVAVIAIGGSAFAYVSYQKPQNVVNDALMSALVAKSATYTGTITYNYTSGSSKIKAVIDIDEKIGIAGTQHHNAKLTLSIDDKNYSIEGDALFDEVGDIYFRVQGLKGIINEAKTSLGITSGSALSNSIDGIVKKIDGTWIRISTDDLNTYSEDFSKTKKCVNEAIDKFKNDQSAISEVTDLYRKNPYITVEKDLGNFSYDLTMDVKAGKAFLISLKNTKIYKSLNTCDKSIAINDKDVNSIPDNAYDSAKDPTVYNISVNQWTHKISELKVTNSNDGLSFSADITPNYDKKVDITTPKPSISITQLQSYIEELTQAVYGGSV